MKVLTLPDVKVIKTYLSLLFLTPAFLFALAFLPQAVHAQQSSLSLADILIGLRSKKAALPEKNKLLTDAVKTRGITFAITDEIEKELKSTGASLDLITAIQQKSPAPKPVAASTPVPTPLPVSKPIAPDYTFYQNQANAHFVKGDYDLAVVNYNKSIELNPKDVIVYLSRALAYYSTKFYDLAVADYTKALELEPKESMIYFKRGDAYEKMGSFEKALADYRKALELDADNESAKSYLQRLETEQAKNAPKSQPVEVPKNTSAAKETPKPEPTAPKSINLGSLSSLAVKLALPIYPPFERQRSISGLVTVQISLDEKGKVLSAKALDGPSSLRSAAEDAARKSKFNPPMLDGKEVKASGFITYNFKLN